MQQQLNQYLFQFRALTLPHFGTIRLVAQPARLDVVEHLIYPPAYEPQFLANDTVSEHQLEYFSAALQRDAAAVETYLTQAGQALKNKVADGALTWSGIGIFEYNNSGIQLHPQPAEGLAPVEARRVMRENVQHSVLVGDNMVMSDPTAERVVEEERGKDGWVIAAWILALLALLFIGYYLYQHHFSPQASGLQRKVQPAATAPTWQ